MRVWHLIVLVTVAALIAFLARVEIRRADEGAAKLRWFYSHLCKPEGYSARNDRLYRCDDGVVYLWRDIPEQEQAR